MMQGANQGSGSSPTFPWTQKHTASRRLIIHSLRVKRIRETIKDEVGDHVSSLVLTHQNNRTKLYEPIGFRLSWLYYHPFKRHKKTGARRVKHGKRLPVFHPIRAMPGDITSSPVFWHHFLILSKSNIWLFSDAGSDPNLKRFVGKITPLSQRPQPYPHQHHFQWWREC